MENTGSAILVPMVSRRTAQKDAASENPEEPGKARVLSGFRVVHVFDVSQTDGQELQEFATVSGDPREKLARLEQVVASQGITLIYDTIPGGALGVSEGGRITVLPTLPKAETFSVLVHELAHELLHRGDRRSDTTRTVRETEAEAVSYVVCRAAGLACSTKSADYIQLYSGDKNLLLQSLELIRGVASNIISELETPVSKEVKHAA